MSDNTIITPEVEAEVEQWLRDVEVRVWRRIIQGDPYLSVYECFIGLPKPTFKLSVT